MHMRTGFLAAVMSLFCGIVSGQAHDVVTGSTLVCASAADAIAYATAHRHDFQKAIESETDGKSCLVADVAFVAGAKADRLQLQDATYMLTEIMVVAVKTPYGYLSMDSSRVYTLLKVEERAT